MALQHSPPEGSTSRLDLGPDVATHVTEAAEDALSKLPAKALRVLTNDLRNWVKDAPVAKARASFYVDPEDETSRYVLLELLAGAKDDDFERLGAELAHVDQASMEKLSAKDKKCIVASYQVTLVSSDEWDDEPAFCLDPADFIRIATRLSTSRDQADLRTAISRAYYASFLRARGVVALTGTTTADVHGQVMRALGMQNRIDQVDLERLRRARNRADYDLRAAYAPMEAQRLVRRSQALFSRL